MHNELLSDFLREYGYLTLPRDPSPAPQGPPDPGVDELIDVEDEMAQFLANLFGDEFSPELRAELRGQRAADLPDLMFEAAEGLSDCPEIGEALRTDPAAFQHVAEQDLSLGGLVQALQVMHQGADLGLLLRAGEARKVCEAIRDNAHGAVRDPALPIERRRFLEDVLSEPLARLEKDLSSQKVLEAKTMKDDEGLQMAKDKQELTEQVHELLVAATKKVEEARR